jgi:DNA polymerase-2
MTEGHAAENRMPEGFILSAHYRERAGRGYLRFDGRLADGQRWEWWVSRPRLVFWIPAADLGRGQTCLQAAAVRRRPLRTMDGAETATLYFPAQSALRRAAECLRRRGIPTLESDVSPTARHLCEHGILGSVRFLDPPDETYRTAEGIPVLRFRDPRIEPGERWIPELRMLSLDIEVSVARGTLLAVALHQRVIPDAARDAGLAEPDGECRRVLLLADHGSKAASAPGAPQSNGPGEPSLTIERFPDESELLERTETLIRALDPDLLVGWNVIGFDLAFLQNKARELAEAGRRKDPRLRLGPSGERLQLRIGGSMLLATLPGRAILDGPTTLRSSFVTLPDMRLEAAAQELLGEGKAIDTSRDKITEIERMFREDPLALARYNIQDALLVTRIMERVGAVELLAHRAHNTGLLIGRVGGSVAAFDNLYLPRLHRAGFVAPDTRGEARGNVLGGLVLESLPGFHENVIVLDFKSLYPSIIRTFHVDPLGAATARRESDPRRILQIEGGMCPFHRDVHILPGILQTLWERRDAAKRVGNRPLSQAIKIVMNSFYGVLGTPGCRFFDPRVSSSITGIGQEIIRRTAAFIEHLGYRVIYGDTDSLFVLLGPDAAETAQQTGRELAHKINQHWRETIHKQYDLESVLEIEFERHYRKLFMPALRHRQRGSKKRYAGLVVDHEGNARIEFTGMEYVRSDWTTLARTFQHDVLMEVFSGRDPQPLIRRTIQRLFRGELDDQLVYRKTVRKRLDDYVKTTPPHVRAARMLGERFQGNVIEYVITTAGPVPVQLLGNKPPDYDHYLEKQLRPIAEAILPLAGYPLDCLKNPRQLGFAF